MGLGWNGNVEGNAVPIENPPLLARLSMLNTQSVRNSDEIIVNNVLRTPKHLDQELF